MKKGQSSTSKNSASSSPSVVISGGNGDDVSISGNGCSKPGSGNTSHIIVQLPIDINEIQKMDQDFMKPKMTYDPTIPKSPRAFEESHDFAFMDSGENIGTTTTTNSSISGNGNTTGELTAANELTDEQLAHEIDDYHPYYSGGNATGGLSEIIERKDDNNHYTSPHYSMNSETSLGGIGFTKLVTRDDIRKSAIQLMTLHARYNDECKWPLTTEIACFWDGEQFSNAPWGIPHKYRDRVFHTYGNFQSPQAAAAYLMEERAVLGDNVFYERMSLLNMLVQKVFPDFKGRVHPAPSKMLMIKYGGVLTIHQYREIASSFGQRAFINYPPIMSTLPQMEVAIVPNLQDQSPKYTPTIVRQGDKTMQVAISGMKYDSSTLIGTATQNATIISGNGTTSCNTNSVIQKDISSVLAGNLIHLATDMGENLGGGTEKKEYKIQRTKPLIRTGTITDVFKRGIANGEIGGDNLSYDEM